MDIAAGTADSPLVMLPGGRVFDPNGSTKTYRPTAQFSARVLLVGSAATRQTNFNAWQAKIGKVGTLTRTGDSSGTHIITARLLSASINRLVANYQVNPMTLVFQAVSFPWEGPTTFVVFPTSMTVSTNVYNYTMTNGGNADFKKVTFALAPVGGSMTLLHLDNATTGSSLSYNGTVLATKTLAIDTGARTVKNDGVNSYAYFTAPTTFEDWFYLQPGANQLNYYATFAGTSVTISVSFKDAWA